MRAESDEVTRVLDERRTEWVRDKQEADTKAQRDRITSLGPDGVCPTCSRALGARFDAVVEALNEQLETLQVDGQYYRDRGEQLAIQPAEITTLDERRR